MDKACWEGKGICGLVTHLLLSLAFVPIPFFPTIFLLSCSLHRRRCQWHKMVGDGEREERGDREEGIYHWCLSGLEESLSLHHFLSFSSGIFMHYYFPFPILSYLFLLSLSHIPFLSITSIGPAAGEEIT